MIYIELTKYIYFIPRKFISHCVDRIKIIQINQEHNHIEKNNEKITEFDGINDTLGGHISLRERVLHI